MATEQIKVFKNVHTQTPTYGSAFEVVLAQTSSSEKAVIKDVTCNQVGPATLDHDGRTIATSTGIAGNMIASGNLIMDVSSVLKLKFSAKTAMTTAGFKGMLFCDSTDGMTFIQGTGVADATGTSTEATSATNRSTSSFNTYSAFAAIKPGESVVTFFRCYSDTIYEYNEAGSLINQYGFGSSLYGACTDGTYMYGIPDGSGTHIYRKHLSTRADTDFQAASNINGQTSNQGSFVLHHDGNLYSKQQGGSSTMYITNIGDSSVKTVSNADISGSYSDGACIVTTHPDSAAAGKSYVVEQGTNGWQWYEIGGAATQFTNASGSSQASTEYGNGGFEIAPGIAMILCEQSDDMSIIDMNTVPPEWTHISSPSSRNITNYNNLGSYFAVAGYLTRESKEYLYDAYTSGVLIEGV